ncbi:hypothetical protein JCM3766R1_002816 [Sporobolomyces carnicolor]
MASSRSWFSLCMISASTGLLLTITITALLVIGARKFAIPLAQIPTRHMPILYLPDTLLDSRRQRAKGALWGWRTRDLTFVVGAIFGKDDEFATRSISKLNEAHGTDLRFIRVSFRKGSPPEILSERDPDWNPSVVVYAPLGRLEALSLQPMPLDLLRGDHQSPGSAGSSRRRHVYLTTKQDIQPEVLSTAKRAVEWVNLSSHLTRSLQRGATARPEIPSHGQLDALSHFVYSAFSVNIAILTCRLPLVGAIRDYSVAARQVVTRLELLASAPRHYWRYRTLCTVPSACDATSRKLEAHANYIRFWNTIWLFANDLIVGHALSTFVRDNAEYLSNLVETSVRAYISAYLTKLLSWLNDWPAGVKLNTELASIICRSFLLLSRLWETFVLDPLLPRLPALLRLFATLGFFGGASLLLALALDLSRVLAFPFYSCYFAAALVYRWSLVSLSALFNVFRGKKYNPLRARTEPASYSMDTLLLGTILFVTLIFLFPTIVAFYMAFSSSRLMLVAIQTGFTIAIQALNSFPLFALMLRVKSPRRLPGGIEFRRCKNTQHVNMTHLHLRSRPLPFSAVFSDILSLARAFFSPRTQLSLVSNLVKGNVISSSRN